MSSEENRREPDAGEEQAEDAGEVKGTPEDQIPGAEPVDGGTTTDDPELVPEEPEPEPAAAEELAAMSVELEAARRERDEYLDALRRLKAEFENSRKRQERERARILETASERLVVELLPVLDNLDRAIEAEGDIRDGVRATRDQFVAVLGNEGLLPVASDGQPFDPGVHEAVMGQPSDEHEEGTILQTFQRGYVLNGKPIRAAKVVVARQA